MTAAAPGPLAQEAVRLVEAITDWARGSVDGSTPSAAAAGEAGGGPECHVCPVCQLLSVLRRTQPETFAHLATASASMVAALRSVVENHDHDPGPRPTTASGVEHIDLDDRDGSFAGPGGPR